MGKLREFKKEWKRVFDPNKPGAQVFRAACKWAYRIRGVLLAIPVAIVAVVLAIRNLAVLPTNVGFILQESGGFAHTVNKTFAVFGPLGVTALCLLLMFCSKRVIYPWLVSVFSLALPVVILLVNTFA